MYKVASTASKNFHFVFFEQEGGEGWSIRNPATNKILLFTSKRDAEFLAKILNKAV